MNPLQGEFEAALYTVELSSLSYNWVQKHTQISICKCVKLGPKARYLVKNVRFVSSPVQKILTLQLVAVPHIPVPHIPAVLANIS